MFFEKVSVEYFIAKRSAESRSGRKPSVMVRVASISVALSVAIMILTLAVLFGYKKDVSRSLTGFTAEAVVTNYMGFAGLRSVAIHRSEQIEKLFVQRYGATRATPYATLQGVVRSPSGAVEGIMMRGVDSLYNFDFLSAALTAGTLPRTSKVDPSRDVLLSASLAERMGIEVGDRLELLVSEEDRSLRRDLYKVCGLYSTGLDEWDRMIAITDLRNVQRLNGWSNSQISGYELDYNSLKEAGAWCEMINYEFSENQVENAEYMAAYTAERLYPAIFDWLKAHNVNAVVIIIIMIIVAGFNMATMLLIMVLERTRMIGVLKSLGMNNRSLGKIFLFRSLEITLKGVVWGNVVALAICLVQRHFEIIKLDAASYLLSAMPIDLSWWWWLLLNAGVVAAILILMIIPARMVSRIEIEKTLKFS